MVMGSIGVLCCWVKGSRAGVCMCVCVYVLVLWCCWVKVFRCPVRQWQYCHIVMGSIGVLYCVVLCCIVCSVYGYSVTL